MLILRKNFQHVSLLLLHSTLLSSTDRELTDEGLVGTRGDNTYLIKDDKAVLEFYAAHKDDSVEDLVHAVCTNEDFWGEDLSAIDGFEASVASYLADIRENGAYEVMKKLVK